MSYFKLKEVIKQERLPIFQQDLITRISGSFHFLAITSKDIAIMLHKLTRLLRDDFLSLIAVEFSNSRPSVESFSEPLYASSMSKESTRRGEARDVDYLVDRIIRIPPSTIYCTFLSRAILVSVLRSGNENFR